MLYTPCGKPYRDVGLFCFWPVETTRRFKNIRLIAQTKSMV
jgi:hypothetical protein